MLDSDEWYPRNAAAASLVQLGNAGLAAVCGRVGTLEPDSLAHYWGVLDAAGGTEATIDRAAAGERRVRRFVTRRRARRGDRPPGGARRARHAVGPLRARRAPSPRARHAVGALHAARLRGGVMTQELVLWVNRIVLGYFVLILVSYTGVTFLSWIQVRRYYRRLVHARLQRSVRSRLTPPISICTAAYNEAEVIVDAMRSMLSLRYPEHEVVLANDGSTDTTLERMIEAFAMYRVDQPEHSRLATARVRGVWRSRTHSNLMIIDKENGGKCDALNAAINFARYPLVCCVDADSLLEPEALVTVVRPFIERPDRTIAAAGIIRIANGCEVTRGHVTKVGLPRAVAADVPDRRVPARLHRGAHRLEPGQLAADRLGRLRDLPQGRRDRRRRLRHRHDRRGLRADRPHAPADARAQAPVPHRVRAGPGLLDGGARQPRPARRPARPLAPRPRPTR